MIGYFVKLLNDRNNTHDTPTNSTTLWYMAKTSTYGENLVQQNSMTPSAERQIKQI